MNPETLFERGLKTIQAYRNYQSKLSVMTGIDIDDIPNAIEERDERVIHAVLQESGIRKEPGVVFETSAKKAISTFMAHATWERRWIILEGPAGCGKSFTAAISVGNIKSMPAAYVRVNGFTHNSPAALLLDVIKGFDIRGVKTGYVFRGYTGSILYKRLQEEFKSRRGLLVLDEAQELSPRNIKFLKDLWDETELSIVLLGASLDEAISPDTLGKSLYNQIYRRIKGENYPISAILPGDVKLILTHYRIKVGDRDAGIVAARLQKLGDVGTLMDALQKFARTKTKGKWSDVGADEIMESIDEVMSKIRVIAEGEAEG